MKAAQINSYGSSEVVEILETAKPTLKESQILVKVKAASINPFDLTILSGRMQKMMPLKFPVTLGGDFAGTVEEIGEKVSSFKVGNEVYGQAIVANGGSGSFAEIVAANAKNTALKPKKLDFLQSASLPLVGTSAIQAIEEHINLQKGMKIFIQGGAGGIGSIAIQLSKMHGAYVATTASAESEAFVKQLGANQFIDYKTQKFEDILNNFDAVFDTVGGEITDRSMQVLKNGGILVTITGQPNEETAKKNNIKTIKQVTRTTTEKLDRLTELVDNDFIKPQIDKIFSLKEVGKAFNYFEKGHPKGKVAITTR